MWGQVLRQDFQGLNITIRNEIAAALFLPNKTVRITSMVEGSLIVEFVLTRNTTESNVPDVYLMILLQASKFPNLAAFYRNITKSTEDIDLKSLVLQKSSALVEIYSLPPPKGWCDANCVMAVYLGGCFFFVIVVGALFFYMTIRKRRRDMKNLKEVHEPYGSENPDLTHERIVHVPEEVVLMLFGQPPPTDPDYVARHTRHRRTLPPHRVTVEFDISSDVTTPSTRAESDDGQPDHASKQPFGHLVCPTEKSPTATGANDVQESSGLEFGDARASSDNDSDIAEKPHAQPTGSPALIPRGLRTSRDRHTVVVFFDDEVFDDGVHVSGGEARRSTSALRPHQSSERDSGSFFRRRSSSRRRSYFGKESHEPEAPLDEEDGQGDVITQVVVAAPVSGDRPRHPDDRDYFAREEQQDRDVAFLDSETSDDMDDLPVDANAAMPDVDRNPLQTDTGIAVTAVEHQPFFTREHFSNDPFYLELAGDLSLDAAASAVDRLAEVYGPQ